LISPHHLTDFYTVTLVLEVVLLSVKRNTKPLSDLSY
jgi:hypothetical protein